ncbi:membrane protein insertion efficiency factor YidD [Candidatus Peregrinibacteria bacterium]|nr:membrane protein insertion efficiency factor YidD [Candidatus Peregrinibacteria bacterium]
MYLNFFRNSKFFFLPRRVAIAIIRFYQKTLSPDHGFVRHAFPFGLCRFEPSCSEYSALAITKYGLLRGGLKTVWRILRCNPWSCGGEDRP